MADLGEYKNILCEQADGWLTIWFNRPDNRNALSTEMIKDISDVLNAVKEDRDVRGITMRGKGGIFCAGGDLKSFKASMTGGASKEDIMATSRTAAEFFNLINTMPQVVIMVIEGAAMAGGLGMACTADVVIAAPDARFSLTEAMLGITPAQISPYVMQKFGYAVARRLMLTAAQFDGAEGEKLGLVDFLASGEENLSRTEWQIKRQVLKCAPGAVAATKRLALSAHKLPREEMVEFAASDFADCLLGDEGREGISSFIEKRKPEWFVDLDRK